MKKKFQKLVKMNETPNAGSKWPLRLQATKRKDTAQQARSILIFDRSRFGLEIVDGTSQEGECTTETYVRLGSVLVFKTPCAGLKEVVNILP